MTGSPLLRLALALCAIALLAIPAWRLTQRETPPASVRPAAAAKPAATGLTEVAFTAANPPALIELEILGKKIFTTAPSLEDKGQGFVVSAEIPLPTAMTDLVVRATWSGTQAMNALRVQVGSEQDYRMDTTLWGNPQIEDVLILPEFPRQ